MTISRSLTASALLASLIAWAPISADAFNPQPEPPGRTQRVTLADGRSAVITQQGKLEVYNADKQLVALPPGPCRLADGSVVHVLVDGSVDKADLLKIRKAGRAPQ